MRVVWVGPPTINATARAKNNSGGLLFYNAPTGTHNRFMLACLFPELCGSSRRKLLIQLSRELTSCRSPRWPYYFCRRNYLDLDGMIC